MAPIGPATSEGSEVFTGQDGSDPINIPLTLDTTTYICVQIKYRDRAKERRDTFRLPEAIVPGWKRRLDKEFSKPPPIPSVPLVQFCFSQLHVASAGSYSVNMYIECPTAVWLSGYSLVPRLTCKPGNEASLDKNCTHYSQPCTHYSQHVQPSMQTAYRLTALPCFCTDINLRERVTAIVSLVGIILCIHPQLQEFSLAVVQVRATNSGRDKGGQHWEQDAKGELGR